MVTEVDKHKIITTFSCEDYKVIEESAKLNPEFNIKFQEISNDGQAVKVAIIFRNATKQEFHQRLIHFFVKTFKYNKV